MGPRVASLAALVAVVAFAGCGLAPSANGHTPTASPAPPTPSAAPLAAWQRLGATQVPPAPLPGATLKGIEVVNQGGASVSDAQGRAWALALIRTYSYLEWATRNGQDGFLLKSGIASNNAVVQSEVSAIQEARQAKATIELQRVTIRRLVVRPLPDSLQTLFHGQMYTLTPYAIFLDAVGPASYTWVDAQGNRTVKYQVRPGASAAELMGGALADISPMGEVWVLGSDWDCTASNARLALGAACAQ
jgi:hypothetical protein